VGIGTASPAYTLDVAGYLRSTQAAYFNSSITVTGESYLEGGAEIFGNSLVSGQWLVGGTTFPSSGKLIVESSTGTNLDLLNNGYAGWSNQIRFLNSSAAVRHLIYDDNTGSSSKTNGELVIVPGYYGNATNTLNIQGQVQIGTDRPVTSAYTPFALSVYGNVVAQQMQVETSDWADFVFDKGYKLPALSDVEAYVNRNKHLPDVPSECEAIEKGVNLGEMNKVLLQKVEELTLYMIQQQKDNEAMKAEIANLKK
jgi:hypothetical protein